MYDKYKIKMGDTLKSLSEKFQTTESNLKDINNIYYDDLLRAGMDIIVPKIKDDYFEYYTIEKGDSLYAISKKYNINPELLASMNGLNLNDYIYPGQELLIPKAGYSYYITTEGDTLDTVASRFKTSNGQILTENETIYLLPGQLLVQKR